MPSRKLAKYRAKRDFAKTTEPSGGVPQPTSGNTYLIQKHAARRLHYDFRLELDGTLKSWAITKGPSLNPTVKRLAVHVEDHPLAYGDFEGTIPKGEYGGGTVMLWDQGSWTPIGDAERGYRKGKLDFELQGKRLKGRWHLVRMHGNRRSDEKRENWLLIKGRDQYANEEDGDAALEEYQTSVVSDRSMESLATGKSKVWKSKEAKEAPASEPAKAKAKPLPKRSKKKPSALAPPKFIAPQLATLVTKPPEGKNWVHEVKFDGYRLEARIDNGEVTLTTRNGNDWTDRFKDVATALATLPCQNAILDGEAVHMAADGTMSFHALQNALSTGKKEDLQFWVFDLLFLDGEDVRHKPLLERKALLNELLKRPPKRIHYSDHFEASGAQVLHQACSASLEGIISKRTDDTYHSGRGESWVKSKCIKEQELVIGGYTTQPKHPGALGALLMGYYDKNDFIFAGKVGTGFSHSEGHALLTKLKKLEQKDPPFKSIPRLARKGAVFAKPELVAHVNFTEWTHDGVMRHPSFQGLREDKPAPEVVREKEKAPPVKKATTSKKQATKAADEVSLTHPDKQLYPGSSITKRDLADYYEKVAPLMLAQIAGRPISLVRCPAGEGKPCFFQRHGAETLSPFVKPVKLPGDKEPYLMIEDARGLTALVQMGVLEIHVWGSNADDPQHPDRLVFDLDPAPDVPFAEVKKAAEDVRNGLKELKLTSFLKTTGGKGLHVVVPFKKSPSWDEAKDFARTYSEAMAKAAPDRFTTNIRKAARTGKIFIDYLRNGEGASAIAAYSTRARKGAPIALPIDWKELKTLKGGDEFHMKDAVKRLKKDPWRAMTTAAIAGQKLPKL
jgi:bifunctional non-homologous end joining protein LigD